VTARRAATPASPVAWAALSALLRYPDEELVADLPVITAAASRLPPSAAAPLGRLAAHLAGRPLLRLQADYVATFDLKRRCSLHLTWYLHGDTRRRGQALWRCSQAFRQAGFTVAGGELPDYLPAILELAASGGQDAAIAMLAGHRAGLVLLGEALASLGSPYAGAVEVLRALLPDDERGAREAAALAARLAMTGPPAELVGAVPPAGAGAPRPGGGGQG